MQKEEIGLGDLLQYQWASDDLHSEQVLGVVVASPYKDKPYLMKVAWFDGETSDEISPVCFDSTGILLISKVSPDSSAG